MPDEYDPDVEDMTYDLSPAAQRMLRYAKVAVTDPDWHAVEMTLHTLEIDETHRRPDGWVLRLANGGSCFAACLGDAIKAAAERKARQATALAGEQEKGTR